MKLPLISLMMGGLLFAAMPSSSSYQLHNYNYGAGGTSNSTSTNYRLNATAGEVSNTQSSSTNFKARTGNNNAQQAYVPTITLSNPASYYNKLLFVVNPGSNPSDTKFAIAISSDGFTTTQYVQNDNTVGSVLGPEDYQTYASWGSGSGQLVIGLTPSTTYQVKVKAIQGDFTETEYGPASSASTVAPSISFDIDSSAADTETASPYAASFGSLLPSTVTNTTEKVWVDIDTNANTGAKIYISSLNGGLKSNANNFTITSATADLASAGTGFGAQGSSVTQSSGGPLSITSPYNVASQNVGILSSLMREIFSASAPITAGRGSLQLKAKAAITTPSAPDYQDTLTLVAAGSF